MNYDKMINCCDSDGISNNETCNVMLNNIVSDCNISGFTKANCYKSPTSL